jgi:hypothetical protein
MYKKLIFVDLENIKKIDNSIIIPYTKLFIMVGFGQEKQGLELLKEKFDKCDAIELIKVNGQGHNALDFFIAFYLGKYYSELKDAKIVICTKDGGFDPLKVHLTTANIDIVRIGSETPMVESPQKTKTGHAKNSQKQQPPINKRQRCLTMYLPRYGKFANKLHPIQKQGPVNLKH